MHTTENKYLLPAAMFLLGALTLTGAILWYGMQSSYSESLVLENDTTLEETGTPPPEDWPWVPSDLEFEDVNGKVVSVGTDRFTVEDESGKGTVVVLVDDATEIYRSGEEKDPQAYQAELDIFYERVTYGDPNRVYFEPEPYTAVPLSLSDLQAGMNVFVDPKEITAEGTLALRVYVGQENFE